ncbi:glycoside hydrolase family 5 protein [Myxococcus sp. K15C18031901]|uniref:glycoside hydrolase family 5 protein n=1 Tax=Myxococcus dinghuensis TaxID=2906761 RepID=UPI0020A6ED9F|nr:cellulase family glycosylhydrolase [Myxococcus dinghuensis]MCP3097796.1 glycoside hydrolase family 5 protein [Myxococcus dinghuensis]
MLTDASEPSVVEQWLLPALDTSYQTVLYDDGAASGWDVGYSWGGISQGSTTSTKAYGASSLQVTSAADSALALGAEGQTFSTNTYRAVSFAIRPGAANLTAIKGLKLIVSQEEVDGNAGVAIGTYASPSFDSLGAGEWTRVTIPMSALKGSLATFNKLTLMADVAVSYGIDGIAIEIPRLPALDTSSMTVLYDDAVASGWSTAYSWGGTTLAPDTVSRAYGTTSLKVTAPANSAMALGSFGSSVPVASSVAVSFAINPGTSNLTTIQSLKVILSQEGVDGNAGVAIGAYANPGFASLAPGHWTRVRIPMSALKGALTTFNKLTLQSASAVVYGVDGIALEKDTPQPPSGTGKTYPTGVAYRGINRAGMEYGDDWDGWTGQTYYEVPSSTQITAELAYYKAKGFNLIRLPISWERIQHTLYGPLDTAYSNGMLNYINMATAQGFTLVLDLHNYNRYATGAFDGAGNQTSNYVQRIIGDGTLTVDHLADVWTKLANLVKTNPKVVLNLMNEPHDLPMTSTTWFSGIQTVMNAVRATGSTQLILVPNTRASDVGHWHTWAPGGGPLDSVAALAITDSANNHAFDMHSYYPEGYGSNDESSYGAQLTAVTNWARTHGKKLFLSEMGIRNQESFAQGQITNALTFMNNNRDVWLGWSPWDLTYWQLTTNNHTADYTANGVTPMNWYSAFLTANFLAL